MIDIICNLCKSNKCRVIMALNMVKLYFHYRYKCQRCNHEFSIYHHKPNKEEYIYSVADKYI